MENHFKIAYLFLAAFLRFCSGASVKEKIIDPRPCRSEHLIIAQDNPDLSSSYWLPRCDDEGQFKPLQTNLEKFECRNADGSYDSIDNYPALGPCHRLQNCLKRHQSTGVKEHKLIRCDSFGYFRSLQKLENGRRICVDLYGNFRKTFGVTGREDCLNAVIFRDYFQDNSFVSAVQPEHKRISGSTDSNVL